MCASACSNCSSSSSFTFTKLCTSTLSSKQNPLLVSSMNRLLIGDVIVIVIVCSHSVSTHFSSHSFFAGVCVCVCWLSHLQFQTCQRSNFRRLNNCGRSWWGCSVCVFALCLSVNPKVVLSTWPFSCCCDLYIRYPYFRLLSPQGDTTLLPLPLSLLCMIKLKGLKCSLPPPVR